MITVELIRFGKYLAHMHLKSVCVDSNVTLSTTNMARTKLVCEV